MQAMLYTLDGRNILRTVVKTQESIHFNGRYV